MKWAILTYVVLCPLFFLPGAESRDVQTIFYQLSSVAIFAIGMFFPQKALKVNKINITLGIMLLAFLGAWLRVMAGWELALNYILGLLVYFTILRTLKKEDFYFLIKGVLWMFLLATIWLILQKLGFDIRETVIRDSGKVGRDAFFFHASSLGMYFAESIPFTLGLTWIGLLFLPIIKFSECSSAYLAIVVSILFFYWFRKRIVFWGLLIPVILGGIYLTINPEGKYSLDVRMPIWKEVIHKIARCPIGHGLNSFSEPILPGQNKFYFNHETNEIFLLTKQFDGQFISNKPLAGIEQLHELDHPHNEYLWLGYEIGLHGLIILGFLFYFIWDRFKRCRKGVLETAFMASLISFAIFIIGQFPLHLARIGFMLPVILAGFIITTEDT